MNNPVPEATRLYREAAQAPGVVRAQLERNATVVRELGARLREKKPRAVVTSARGSSDHAATYAKYLVETRAGVLTASAAPSVASVYHAQPDLRDCLFLAISQSGRSPDLLAGARHAAEAGAVVVALVNDEDSPLAREARYCVPLCAGAEESVAATKSYIASLAAIAHVVAAWTEDAALMEALHGAAAALERAWALDWRRAVDALATRDNLFVIARGVGLAIAQEAALKCKETCGLHAESFSSAEVRHGPQALLKPEFPALVFGQDDETLEGTQALARDLVARGVEVIAAGLEVRGALLLPTIRSHPALQPLLIAQAFYKLANAVALERGLDPDRPPHLQKVTRTT
jgi:glutamine---fructose-6-phosphate transaminase (isomerizing)